MDPLRKPQAAFHAPPARDCAALGDLRFRNLLSSEDWNALPPAVRARFSKRLAQGATAIYVGEVVEAHLSFVGRTFAQAARLIGGPLPTSTDCGVPSIVTVTEDVATGGQIWSRLYARKCGFPQIVHSSKCFSGVTGLEEYVAPWIGMALTVHVENAVLLFRSAFYFVRLGRWRLKLPAWLTPGALTVTHAECGEGQFVFMLDIVHPRFGRIIRQIASFREATP